MLLRHTLPTAAALMIAISFAACSHGDDVPNNNLSFTTVKGQALYRLDNTAGLFKAEHDIAYQDSATLILPVDLYGHNLDALKDTIMKVAFDTVAPDVNVIEI